MHQLELYKNWPEFTYHRAGYLNEKKRNVLPKTINDGAQYLLHDAERTYAIMGNIFKLAAVLSVTEKDIQDAFGQKWKDYADATLPVHKPVTWIEETGML